MKKVLSFVLVLAMILGSVSMVFAAPAKTAAKAPVPFKDAETSGVATILRDLGVLTGVNGEALLDETITRAELCAVLVRALGYESLGKVPTATKFTDVDATAWYSGYIAVANTMGLVDGVTAKQFMPEETVTGYEAVAFILKALGYDAAHLAGNWPMNYVTKAYAISLLGKFVPSAEIATRNEVFTLIYNALTKWFVKWNGDLDDYKQTSDKNDIDCLMTRLGGSVTGDGVYGETIKQTEYVFEKRVIDNSGADRHVEFANEFDAAKYAGKYVELVKKNSDKKEFGINKVISETLEGKFSKDADYAASTTDLKNITFAGIDKVTYKFADTVNKPTGGVKYFYNGKVANYIVDKFTSKASLALEVEFDGDKIASLYSISLWDETAAVVVTSTMAGYFATEDVASLNAIDYNGVATDVKFATKAGVEDDDENEYLDEALLVVEGAATKLSDIKEDDVIEIYATRDNDISKVVVTRSKVAGKVTEFDKINKKYTVAGTKYQAATIYDVTERFNDYRFGVPAELAQIQKVTTSEYAFYLNADGKFVGFELADKSAAPETDVKYGVLLRVGYADSKATGVDEKASAEANAQFAIYNFVDGKETVYGTAKKFTSSIYTNFLDYVEQYSTGYNFKGQQLVKYELKDGKLGTLSAIAYDCTDGDFYAADVLAKNKTSYAALTVDGFGGKLFAADAKIVKIDNTNDDFEATNAAFIAQVAAADVKGNWPVDVEDFAADLKKAPTTTYTNLLAKDAYGTSNVVARYHLDKNGKIDILVLAGLKEGDKTAKSVTAAAIVAGGVYDTGKKDGTQFVDLLVEGKVERYEFAVESKETDAYKFMEKYKDGIFQFNLVGGKIKDATPSNLVATNTILLATGSNLDKTVTVKNDVISSAALEYAPDMAKTETYEGNTLRNSLLNAVTYKYDSKDKIFKVNTQAFATAVKDAKSVVFVDTNLDGYYDLIVIDAPVAYLDAWVTGPVRAN